MKTSTIIAFLVGFFAGFAASFVLHIYWHSTKNMQQADRSQAISNQIWECADSAHRAAKEYYVSFQRLPDTVKFQSVDSDSLLVKWHYMHGYFYGLTRAWEISTNK